MSVRSIRPSPPELTGPVRDAVRYRGGHVQIIVAAESGETEVVSQPVAGLLAGGFPAESIVVFMFTDYTGAAPTGQGRRVQEGLG